MPVAFEHLWKIASKVGVVEGHDLSKFDLLCQVGVKSSKIDESVIIQQARSAVDQTVEPQPLWEYKSVCTGYPTEILRFNFEDRLPTNNTKSDTTIQTSE